MSLTVNTLAFWRDWPPGRQRRFVQLLLVAGVLISLLCWHGLYAATQQAEEEARAVQKKHQRTAELVQRIRGLEQQHDQAPGQPRDGAPVLVAVRQVSRDMGLEDKLASVRPALQAAGRDGVRLYYERLNLPELLALLEALQREAGMRTSSMTFNRRVDDDSLADLQLVLYR